MLWIVMQRSQILNWPGLSSSKSCICCRRNKLESSRASCSSWWLRTVRASWTPSFTWCLLITRNAFLASPLPLSKCQDMLLQETSDSRARRAPVPQGAVWRSPLTAISACLAWHIGQVPAPREEHFALWTSDRTETLTSCCQSPAERETHLWGTKIKRLLSVYGDSSGCCRHGGVCSVGFERCGTETPRAAGGAWGCRGLVHGPDSWIGLSCEWCAASCAACEVFHHVFSPCPAQGVVRKQLCGAQLPTDTKAQQQCGANACLQAGKDVKCTERLAGTRWRMALQR